MNRTCRTLIAASLLCVVSVSCAAFHLDSLAVRFAVPLGDRAGHVGFEIAWDTSFGRISGAILLDPRGGTVIQATGHLAIWGSGDPFTATACVSAAAAFLRPASWLPLFTAGGGLGVRWAMDGPWVDARAELLYPMAFSPPWITFGAGWSP